MENFLTSTLERKAAMYEMITAIEADFVNNFHNKLNNNDIPKKVIESSNTSNITDKYLSILQGLDFQSYIEICNANITKLNINISSKDFLNKEFCKIIPIRNNVMHPRPLGVFDYHIVKAIFDEIHIILDFFEWPNVYSVRKKISEHPEELKLPPKNYKKSESVIENLPITLDFEDTSFIGRRKEIGELKSKLNKNNVHILSIIGDGGIGKTAIALKLLYELLDDDNSQFNLILWSSLKTNELNNYEFKEIANSISDISRMYDEIGDFVGVSDSETVQKYLIDLSKKFNALLVLDNLETINTSEIKGFLDEFTENGKVLITSRIGLGEMEHRYNLNGLDQNDVMEYMNILLELHGFQAIMSDKKKKEIAINQLYSNPLAIKWFVRCLYNGNDIETILQNKSELITFCMSNVYDKLTKRAQNILDVLIVANTDLRLAEIMYYLECTLEDYKDISYSINDLVKCNFINDTLFRTEEKVSITNFAKDFLKINYTENKDFIYKFKEKELKLQAFLQKQLQNNHKSPYVMKAFDLKIGEMDKLVAAYYLNEAISLSSRKEIDEAFKLVDYAKKLAPNYYQCNKVAAYLYGTTSQNKAREEYEIAIQCCKDETEKITAYIIYAGYLLRCNDYYAALEKLLKAETIENNINIYIILEKVKIYGCLNKFDEAYKELNCVDINKLSINEINIFLTRKADLKRRESELYGQGDIDRKINLIKQSFDILDKIDNKDRKVYQYIALLIETLSYMYYDENALIFIVDILDKYYQYLRKEFNYKRFQKNMRSRVDLINYSEIKNRIKKYVVNLNDEIEYLSENEGIVYVLNFEKRFGFFRNVNNPKGVYFKLNESLENLQIGYIVCYNIITETSLGVMADKILSYRESNFQLIY